MNVLALDIGGANIKAAWGECGAGEVTMDSACTLAFALWNAPSRLADMLRAAAATAGSFHALAVTMTGELCDCYETRRDGVRHILDCVKLFAGDRQVGVWLTEGRFAPADEANDRWLACASANWHALATWVARAHPAGATLLIDTGSTTTDITLLRDGRVEAKWLTDMDRLHSGELVYLGAKRTPLCALGPTVTARGKRYRVMAECFARTEDLSMVFRGLPMEVDNLDTADGRPLTPVHSAARIARMVGADLSVISEDDARCIARGFRDIMVSRMAGAIRRVLGDVRPIRAVVCGSGEGVACQAVEHARIGVERRWKRLMRDYTGGDPRPKGIEMIRMSQTMGKEAGEATCAAALLHLWGNPGTGVPGL